MEYRKERNIICAYDENGKFCGGWDILTGGYIGARHLPVKNKPKNLFTNWYQPSYYEQIFSFWRSYFSNDCQPYTCCGSRMEELVSLNLLPECPADLTINIKLSKDLVSFLHEHCNSIFSNETVEYYKFLRPLPNITGLNNQSIELLRKIYNNYKDIKIDDKLIKLIHILQNEHVIDIKPQYEITDMIVKYYKWQSKMYNKVEIDRHFLTNYNILEYLYKEYEKVNYNVILKENNDLPHLYFETETLFARPLLTREDFHAEATYQQNCVERMYMERVKDGRTNVVVIRKKSAPDTPYITCEVCSNSIIQYLTRFNNIVHDNKALEFKKLYAQHLKEVSGNNA